MKFTIFFFLLSLLSSADGFAQSLKASSLSPEPLQFSGSFRLRQERIEVDNKDPRIRSRIKAVLGAETKVSEKVEVKIQLASGEASGTATSSNQSFGDKFEGKEIWLNQAYAKWKFGDQLTLLGGKSYLPVYRPNKSEMIWDSDISPEGLSLLWKKTSSETEYFANALTWIFDTRYDSSAPATEEDRPDAIVLGGQLGAKFKDLPLPLTVGLSYYEFTNIESYPLLPSARGNSVVTLNSTDVYEHAYQVLEAFFELESAIGEMPVGFFADFAQNLAISKQNLGYLVGFKLGESKKAEDVMFSYSFREVQKDFSLASPIDSDFASGFSDAKGHHVRTQYSIDANTSLGLIYSAAKIQVSSAPKSEDRGQFDVTVNF